MNNMINKNYQLQVEAYANLGEEQRKERVMYTHITNFHKNLDLNEIKPIKNNNTVKPDGGFWVSVNNGWERWCSRESPDWLTGKRYRVHIKDTARVISVHSAKNLKYLPQRIPDMFKDMPKELLSFTLQNNCFLDFEEIAHMADVIEIYAESGRGLRQALYTWDCDSAVILHPEVIERIEEIEPFDPDELDNDEDDECEEEAEEDESVFLVELYRDRIKEFKREVAREVCADDDWESDNRINIVPDRIIAKVLHTYDLLKRAPKVDTELEKNYKELIDALKECVAFDITSKV